MKRAVLFAVIGFMMLGLAFSAFAQEKKPELSDRAKQRVERQLKSLTEALKLTEDQQKKVKAILEKDAASMTFDRRSFRDMSQDERMEMMQKMRKQREKTNKEIEKLLTPEQVKKFQEYLKNQRNRMRRGRRG